MAETKNPLFASLVAASSIVVALIFVAGYSFRWAYYYNFGLRDIVFDMPVQSVLIGAIELIRDPAQAARSALIVVGPVLVLVLLYRLLLRAAASRRGWLARPAGWASGLFGLSSPVVRDVIVALVLVFSAMMAGSLAGYETFRSHMDSSFRNPLRPVAVVLAPTADATETPIGCDPRSGVPVVLAGGARMVTRLQKLDYFCSIPPRTWRLLYRDDSSIYLFATDEASEGDSVRRPVTLILPATDETVIIME